MRQALSAQSTTISWAARSGRRSRERRPPVAAPNPHLTPFQSRSGAAEGRENERSPRSWPTATVPRSARPHRPPACDEPLRAEQLVPLWPLAPAVVLANDGLRSRLRIRISLPFRAASGAAEGRENERSPRNWPDRREVISPRAAARPALAARSGRRSRERRPPVAAPNPHLTPFQSREWSGRRPRERAVTPELANRNRPPQRSPAPATRLR
jgi:hypothetical protein